MFLGGEDFLDSVVDADSVLSEWGKDHGCECLELCGRRGWERSLKKVGFKPTFVSLSKELSDAR